MPGARLNITLTPSRRHWQLLLGAHGALLFAVAVLPLSLLGQVLLGLAVLINLLYTRRLLLRQSEIAKIVLEHEQLNALRRREWCAVERLTPLLVTSWLTIVKLRISGASYVLPLWPDSADEEAVRQLRVWLLCGGWKQITANKRA